LGGQLYVVLSPALMSMTEGGLGGDQMQELTETRRHCVGQKHRCKRKQETAREAFGFSREDAQDHGVAARYPDGTSA
jgi:hypothetical protein